MTVLTAGPARLSISALAALIAVGSALLPPSHLALAEATLGTPIPVGAVPIEVGVNPATNRIYVTNAGSSDVTVIDGVSNSTVGSTIKVGGQPSGVGVNPTTNRIYVATFVDNNVTMIDGATNTVIGTPLKVGGSPEVVAVNPTTNRVYTASISDNTVSVIDGASNTLVGQPIPVGKAPIGVAVNTITNHIYVVNQTDSTVSVIDGATNTVIGTPITVGKTPVGVEVNPVTNRVYVTNNFDKTVSVIDGATNTVVGTPIPVGTTPTLIAVNPATNLVYISDSTDDTVTVIDGATNAVVGSPIPVGKTSLGVAVNPVTNRIYVPSAANNSVTVIGIPFSATASTATPGASLTATWSSLLVSNGADFVGLFEPAPNTAPLSRRFTNDTASPSGGGVREGSAELPIPASLAAGSYEVRLVSGAAGATLARTADTAPVAANDSYTNAAGTVLTVPAPGVLANDSDAESSPLQAAVATNPAHGTLSLEANGAFTYTPGPTFAGTDSFTYRATDKPGLPGTATVTIAVSAAPVGTNDTYTVASGAVLTVPAPGVLANDTDADSPSLQATIVSNPAHGTLNLQSDGSFTYTPAAGFSGADGFSYKATDQLSLSLPVTVTIQVTAPPVAPASPVTSGDTFTVTSGTTLNIAAPGVLANDTDADSPSLQAIIATGPAHGTLNLQASGAFTYTPSADFAGTDTFTYRASDGSSQSAPAMVSIAVSPTDCSPRPRVQTAPAPGGGKLNVHVESTPLNTHQPNPLRTVRFGTFQNAKVTLDGQPIASGQTFTVPAGSSAVDFTVERVTPGQATTVPLAIVDGCGEWPTFVGGGTGAGF